MEQMEGERIDGEVRRALGALSASDASLLALTTFDHYSPAQVASALGISNGAARTRLHRARTRMAEVLGTSLDGDCDDPRKEDAR
jgi:RNA polymerase sigma-70 factor (ECF subfamily)